MANSENLNRTQVLEAYRQAVLSLNEAAEKDPSLIDAAIWTNYQIKLFTEAFEAKNLGQPSVAALLTADHLPDIPEGYGFPALYKQFKEPDNSGQTTGVFFGLNVDDPLASLRRNLTFASQPDTQKTSAQIIETHSIPSPIIPDSLQLRSGIYISFELQRLGSPSHPVPRLNNGRRLARSRMLILPLR